MDRMVGTVSRGIRAPIIRQGDDLSKIVVDSVLTAAQAEQFEIRDRDVIAVTEAVVARAQGNYAHVDQIAKDVRNKFGGDTVGTVLRSASGVLPKDAVKLFLCSAILPMKWETI